MDSKTRPSTPTRLLFLKDYNVPSENEVDRWKRHPATRYLYMRHRQNLQWEIWAAVGGRVPKFGKQAVSISYIYRRKHPLHDEDNFPKKMMNDALEAVAVVDNDKQFVEADKPRQLRDKGPVGVWIFLTPIPIPK